MTDMPASAAARPDEYPLAAVQFAATMPAVDPPAAGFGHAPSTPTSRRNERLIALISLAIGSAIAALRPFDVTFGLVTADSAILRALLLPAFGIAGLLIARRVGLPVAPVALRHPIRTSLAVALGVAVAVTLIDCFIFRAVLPADHLATMTATGTGDRMLYFMLRAVHEQILYRLFLMSLLVWGLSLIWRDAEGRPATGVYWAAIVLAQIANIAVNVPLPVTPILCLYDMVRYIGPGIVWGYLYWRHGFATAEMTHVSTHIFLQPAFGLLLP